MATKTKTNCFICKRPIKPGEKWTLQFADHSRNDNDEVVKVHWNCLDEKDRRQELKEGYRENFGHQGGWAVSVPQKK